MFSDVKLLLNSPLFKDFQLNSLLEIIDLDNCIIGNYKKGTLIAQEGEPCTSIGFILTGILAIQQLTPSGEVFTLKIIESSDAFGTTLYSAINPKYPFTFVTIKDSKVLYIPFDKIRKLLRTSQTFNDNFIVFLSSRVITFKEKLQMFQYKDVRSKLMLYLSNEYKACSVTTFKFQHSKVEIADIIGVARPSVSRELKNMVNDHLIQISGQTITLLKPELF
ncbi:global nitrogen regulator [Clostridium homopropionicum DSM 5847]|uniref:Global nitrogen regulator n=1 Tax=Clostridium homopropionicum DSM 5847 TaxID=1121318 RepID=A0A0L6Z8J8_9CLOT|nr:Crp/Fnr family transcriptional regulator [Clostridium homopropionicum]KOA19295.1 global nitrogen regulator [Clostridium homopropionicum DSM 5847]SFG20142.1 cAMP-binding domain of CRP or a regulatory subunit of cAMP-dependent protein kinases [Clostridium homopropionicum]